MKLEEAIKHCKNNLDKWKKDRPDLSNTEIVEEIDYDYKALETVLNHLTKQEKMTDKMARFIDTELSSEHLSKVLKIEVKPLETYREDIKQYFEKKAEEVN